MRTAGRPSFIAACCEEPFRVFFPLGVLVGVAGVSLWPLYFSGIHKFYPGLMHARLMVEGFMAAFVFGFLGTAAPRLTSTPHFTRAELGTLVALYVAVVALQIAERSIIGDAVFLTLLLCFVTLLGRRFAKRSEMPPPGFTLVAMGFAAAIAGLVLILLGATGRTFCVLLGGAFLNQAFVLFLVLGVGSFLLPRFLSMPPKPEGPGSRAPTPEWLRGAVLAAGAGVVILATFIAEASGFSPRVAALVRFAATAAYLLSQVPLHRNAVPRVTLAQTLRFAILLVVAGLLAQAIWPMQRLAALHVVFIGGFSLVTLTVATRVILGHAGFGHLFQKRLWFVIGMSLLIAPAMALRFLGDFFPALRANFLSIAAYAWMAGVGVWAFKVLPKVRVVEGE